MTQPGASGTWAWYVRTMETQMNTTLNATETRVLRTLSNLGHVAVTDTGYGLWWRATVEGGRAVGHRRW